MEPVHGVHLGLVVSAGQDPENRNRVQVWVPHLSVTSYTSLNAKVQDPKFKDPAIKGPQDLFSIDQNLLGTLQTILPWAECAAPFFGGSSGLFNTATNTTANTTGSTIQGTTNDPKGIPQTTLNQTLSGVKPEDNKTAITNITPNPSAQLNVGAMPPGLQPYAQYYIDAAKQYNLDPNFLVAISWEETGAGTSQAFLQGNNAMGISNSNGPIYGFASVADSINQQARTLANPNGPYAGASTIAEIGNIYAPSGARNDFNGTNGGWGNDVSVLYSKLTGQTSDQSTTVANFNPSATGVRTTQYTDGASKKGMVPFNIAVAGSAVGTYSTPPPGAKVFVFFLGGDIQKPVYFAQTISPGDMAALTG